MVELLETISADPALRASARTSERAMGLLSGVEWLLAALPDQSTPLKVTRLIAELHRLRGHCDFEPLERFAPALDEAIAEATQTALLQ